MSYSYPLKSWQILARELGPGPSPGCDDGTLAKCPEKLKFPLECAADDADLYNREGGSRGLKPIILQTSF